MTVKRVWEIPSVRMNPPAERNMQVVLSKQSDDVRDFSFLVANLYPHGGSTSIHTHDCSDELVYVVSGRGVGQVGDETVDIVPDTVLYAPAGVPHGVTNLGDEGMKLACFFIPGLPDERIAALTDGAVLRIHKGKE
ncbi:MAG: cupin domain-containing protein [Firmicutes bacterium]|jgi:mannose-6-phosphate isomerase-like protein (cupin superfamily)|nr:cupin domain-containing protein [Bacillota bacterium]